MENKLCRPCPQLRNKYERNFTEKNMRRMIKFAEQFTDFKIVSTLSTQLSWSHFVELLPLKNLETKLFYAQAAATQAFGYLNLWGKLNRLISKNNKPIILPVEIFFI